LAAKVRVGGLIYNMKNKGFYSGGKLVETAAGASAFSIFGDLSE
jgi:hypothetical protein